MVFCPVPCLVSPDLGTPNDASLRNGQLPAPASSTLRPVLLPAFEDGDSEGQAVLAPRDQNLILKGRTEGWHGGLQRTLGEISSGMVPKGAHPIPWKHLSASQHGKGLCRWD